MPSAAMVGRFAEGCALDHRGGWCRELLGCCAAGAAVLTSSPPSMAGRAAMRAAENGSQLDRGGVPEAPGLPTPLSARRRGILAIMRSRSVVCRGAGRRYGSTDEGPSRVSSGAPGGSRVVVGGRGYAVQPTNWVEFEPSAQAIRSDVYIRRVRQAERDAGQRTDGVTTDEREELARLMRSAGLVGARADCGSGRTIATADPVALEVARAAP